MDEPITKPKRKSHVINRMNQLSHVGNRMKQKLDSPKMHQFVKEYAATRDPKASAIAAGYGGKTPLRSAYRLLARDDIKAEIAKVDKTLEKERHIKNRDILIELRRVCFSDIRKLFDANGALLPMSEWDDEIAKAVASVEVVQRVVKSAEGDYAQEFVKKIRLWDKNVAIEKAMKHLGLLIDRVRLGNEDGSPVNFTMNLIAPPTPTEDTDG